jgi:hypothetical protein
MLWHFEIKQVTVEIALFEHCYVGIYHQAWVAFLIAIGDHVFTWSLDCEVKD